MDVQVTTPFSNVPTDKPHPQLLATIFGKKVPLIGGLLWMKVEFVLNENHSSNSDSELLQVLEVHQVAAELSPLETSLNLSMEQVKNHPLVL